MVESRRVNGKPRPSPVLPLGTAAQRLQRRLTHSQPPFTRRSDQHGDVAALKAMADRLGLVALLDRHLPASRRPRSLGTTRVLAAINRAVWPCAKRAWAAWAQRTSLPHRFALRPAALTSPYCWDQRDAVSGVALEAIAAELPRPVVPDCQLKLDPLVYDTSTLFTDLASGHERSTIAQRGHSTQKRFALRQFSLALLVARDGQSPLYADSYEGKTVEAPRLPDSLPAIRQRVARVVGQWEDLTLVYDTGNNAQPNQALVDQRPVHSVAALVPSHHADLRAMPTAADPPVGPGPLARRPVSRCQPPIWGVERTVVRFRSTKLRMGHIRGRPQHVTKRLQALTQWQQTLAKPHSGPRTPASARKQVAALVPGPSIAQVLTIAYDGQRAGAHRLPWGLDHAALEQLETAVFGKRILSTDQQAWSTAESILAYRGQSRAAALFRQRQDVRHWAVRPPDHGTDPKIRVQMFICRLALLLCRLGERESRGAGYQGSLSSRLDVLGSIRLAMVLWPAETPRGQPRCGWVVEERAPDAWHLSQRLVPPVPPLV